MRFNAKHRSRFTGALALVLTPVARAQRAPAPAPATEVDPDDPWEVGKAAYDAGRSTDALRAFETSYKQTRKPRALYRVADTADKLGHYARAAAAFQEYLSLVPTHKDRPFIEGRIQANQAAQARGAAAPSQPSAASSAAAAPAPAAATAPGREPNTGSGASAAGPVWLWAGAGVVAVAAIVIAGVLIGSSSGSSTPAPVRGNVGGTIQTLGAP